MIYIPLYDLTSNTIEFEFNHFTKLKKKEIFYDLVSDMDKNFFSKREIESVNNCSHYLEIDVSHCEIAKIPYLSEKIEDIFLVASWIHKPLKVYMKYSFGLKSSKFDSTIIEPHAYRILHRKRRNKFEDCEIRIYLDDLNSIKEYFNKLIKLYTNTSRLQLAATFTFWGMVSMTWIEAFIILTNTFEILLTFKSKYRIKRKLALACACILEYSDIKRNAILEEFCSLYKFRCDIVHGKTETILDDIGYRYLSRISNLLRLTLRRILENDHLITKLNGSDSERKQLIKDIQGDYIPDFSFLDN